MPLKLCKLLYLPLFSLFLSLSLSLSFLTFIITTVLFYLLFFFFCYRFYTENKEAKWWCWEQIFVVFVVFIFLLFFFVLHLILLTPFMLATFSLSLLLVFSSFLCRGFLIKCQKHILFEWLAQQKKKKKCEKMSSKNKKVL